MPLPNRETRRDIFAVHTRGKPLASDVDLELLAGLTDGFVGGDLSSLCRRATMLAIREHVEQPTGQSQGVQLAARHFQQALEAVMKASQFARGQRFLREIPSAERPVQEPQQMLTEPRPPQQRSSPLA